MHTPGPWTAMEYAINKNLISVYGNSDTPICNIFITNYALDLANAALIEAAPDLEDICIKVASRPAEVRKIMVENEIVIDDLDDPMQKFAFTLYNMLVQDAADAKCAVAKARGDNETN